MAATERALPFRGDLQGLVALGNTLLFTTTHPEGQPTALYRLDVDQGELREEALSAGGQALVVDEVRAWVAGTDGHVYHGPRAGGALKALGSALNPAPRALALLSQDRVAAATGADVAILSRKSGELLQRLPLGEEAAVLASDPSGAWLVAGTTLGTLVVFEAEKRATFQESERKKLHEGAVTALCFEPGELRVLSSGADVKLLSTHIRGRLEPEDRGGKAAHDAPVRAIAFGTGERFYTAGKDANLKVWETGTSKRRPATVKDGVPAAVGLAVTELKGRPHLAIAGEDATIRLFALDAAGKVGDPIRTFTGAMAWARAESSASDAARREAALVALARWNDAPSLDLLLSRASDDADHGLRVRAATLLGQTGNPRARAGLERLLSARDEAVRRAALTGLRALDGQDALRPLDLALAAKKPDIGVAAVEALVVLSRSDDQALTRLVGALDGDPVEVRVAALTGLESVMGAGPEADLQALRSRRPDVRRLALVRCFQRKLLGSASVQSALRRHAEDADADVRGMAWLVAVISRPKLSDALRHLDRDLHRQLHELETYGQTAAADAKLPKTKEIDPGSLGEDDLAPLLQAMSTRALDTCLRGATGLAMLQDTRAFGTLLQLSRESTASARVAACKALQALGDARATNRLRTLLRDGQAEVRDAAFTALARLLEGEGPLAAASAGLSAQHEDVRKRGLEILVRDIRKTGAAKADKAAIELLGRTLDDAAPGVRSEAFKAALNLSVDGGGASSLRFALRSIHADLRREVLVEVEGRIAEPWAPALLLELFGDPEPGLRKDAFEFASKRAKPADVEHLKAALSCRYPDLRIAAATALSKRHTAGARALLVNALDDEDPQVRRLSVDALVVDEAHEHISKAMNSRFPDVAVRAAAARASAGDAAALAPLLALVAEPAPETGDKGPWLERTEAALGGLASLGDPSALDAVSRLIDHPEARIRRAASRALSASSRPGNLDALRRALQHADPEIKLEAAVGLATYGDPAGASILFAAPVAAAPARKGQPAQPAQPTVSPWSALLAAVALGDAGRDHRLATLDHNDKDVRDAALMVALMTEWLEEDDEPDQCLAALSSANARVRLLAARALEQFGDRAAFGAVVVEVFNDRGDGVTPWTVPAATVRTIATLVTSEKPAVRSWGAFLVNQRRQSEQQAFDRAWRSYEARHKPAVPPEDTRKRGGGDTVTQLVFGAYVGLSRLKGGSAEVRIQQTAISRLLAMAARDPAHKGGVIPVLVQALSDNNQVIRKQAFDGLRTLGMSSEVLGAEALSSESRDVGALGLQLLSESGGGDGVLIEVMLSRVDGLEEEALKLLQSRGDSVDPLARALDARSSNLRDAAVAALARRISEPAAAEALRGALSSRYKALRFRAAEELSAVRDAAAFSALVELLASDQNADQRRAITALGRLGDPRGPAALLDRIDRDPAGSALKGDLLAAAGASRQGSLADRLFGYLPDTNTRTPAARAILAISGHDQSVVDEEDATAVRRAGPDWESRQHARDDGLLARLLDSVWQLADARLVREFIPAARWSRSGALDPVLAPLIGFADDNARYAAVDAIGWRLRRREGPVAPLIKALDHADIRTRFYAAEGLARAGRREGVIVLLACVDALDDINLRRRAVDALGKLGDARALDTLLRLVTTEGHALVEQGAEAIGHLADSPKSAEILDLLKKMASGDDGIALSAMTGLRWFGGTDAWALLRSRARDDDWRVRQRAAELLGFDADPASRELLIALVGEDNDSDVVREAFVSLRRLCGPDSLEPDYAILRGRHSSPEPDTLTRLGQRGDPGRLMDLLAKIGDNRRDVASALTEALLSRSPPPLAEAGERLAGDDDAQGTLAARVLGRAGAAASAQATALAAATTKILDLWRQAQVDEGRNGPLASRAEALTGRVRWLLWACGRAGVGEAEVIAAARLSGTEPRVRSLRAAALTALADGLGGADALLALAEAVTGPDAASRAIAAAGLAARAPDRASSLVSKVLDDPTTLGALRPSAEAAAGGLGSVHTQGVVLPTVVRQGDVSDLAKILLDRSLPEAVRMGAAEGLGRVGTVVAEAPLIAVGRSKEEEEGLRKAAWRALRRARRARKAADNRPEVRP